MYRNGWLVLLILVISAPGPVHAQKPLNALGTWRGCFLAEGQQQPACGDVLLNSARSCYGYGDGLYTLAFDSLGLGNSGGQELRRPSSRASFSWKQVTRDSVHLTRRQFPAESPEGEPVCPMGDESSFDAWGGVVGDALRGTWVWHRGGQKISGTFALTRIR
jgi:hypothetical protein